MSSRNRRKSSKPLAKQSPQQRRPPQMASLSSTVRIDVSESIPPPTMLADYNDAIPNGAERVMAMAERQQSHRLKLESRVITNDVIKSYIGLVLGSGIILFALYLGYRLVLEGHDAQGLFIGTGALAVGLGTFFWGTKKRAQQIEELRRQQ